MYCALNVRLCVRCDIVSLYELNDGAGGLFCGVGWPVGWRQLGVGRLANQHCGNQPISAL